VSGLDDLWSQAHLATAFRAITIAVLILVVLITVFCFGLVVHHAFSSRRRNRRGRLVRQANPYLAASIGGWEPLGTAVREARSRFGDWATAVVLRDARRELRGARAAEISAALLEMGEVRRLRLAARSRVEWKRAQAVRDLGQCGGDEAQAELLEAAQDSVPEVRRAARDGLLSDGRPQSVQAAMRSFLRDAPTRTTWRPSFYAHLASAAAGELRRLLSSGTLTGDEEKLGLEALGEVRDPEAVPLARMRLSAPDPEIRATAARVLGKLGDTESGPELVSLLRDSEWFVRAAAARAFESLRADEAAISALAVGLSDETWWVRNNATQALASQGEAGAGVLLSAAFGMDVFSRDAALAALGRFPLVPAAKSRFDQIVTTITRAGLPSPVADGALS
jgi:HEAT repeat protein